MKNMSSLDKASWFLVIAGAINWGLVGGFKYNLVTTLLGGNTQATKLAYMLVGLAGLWCAYNQCNSCKK